MLIVTISCGKNFGNIAVGLIGKWQLTQTLSDPGDGSGTWMNVNTNDYVEFTRDSTFITNGNTAGNATRFSLLNDSTIIFISPARTIKNYYKIVGNQLTLTGGCIEACGSKYIRKF